MPLSIEQSLTRSEEGGEIFPVERPGNLTASQTISETKEAARSASDLQLVGLLQAVAQKDKAAFSDFYDLTNGQIFTLAFHILRDQHAASEVTLNVFMQVWSTAADYELLNGRPLNWLLGITRNCAIDRLRAATNKLHTSPGSFSQPLVTTSESQAPANLFLENHSHIQATLNKLDASQRVLVEAAYYEGLSYSELAVKFDLPQGTVKTYLHSAMVSLKKDLSVGASRY